MFPQFVVAHEGDLQWNFSRTAKENCWVGDPDEHRRWVWDNKSRELKDKRVSVGDAVERSMHDGDLLTFGGFGHVRVSMAFAYEIICQRWRDLAVLTKTGVHDVDLLIGAGCVRMVEVAYVFGHELRGLSPACRRRRGDRGRG